MYELEYLSQMGIQPVRAFVFNHADEYLWDKEFRRLMREILAEKKVSWPRRLPKRLPQEFQPTGKVIILTEKNQDKFIRKCFKV